MFNAEGSPLKTSFSITIVGMVWVLSYTTVKSILPGGHWGLMPRSEKLCTINAVVTEKFTLMLFE